MDRETVLAIAPSFVGGMLTGTGMAWVGTGATGIYTALTFTGLVLMFVGYAAVVRVGRSQLAPVVTIGAATGLIGSVGAVGVAGHGLLGPSLGLSLGAVALAVLGVAGLPYLARDALTEAASP